MQTSLTQVLLHTMTEKQGVEKDPCCHGKLKKRADSHCFLHLQGLALSPHLQGAGFSLKSWPLANLMGKIRKTKAGMFWKTPSNPTEVNPNGMDSCLGS